MKQRVEDLGKLSILIQNLLSCPIFMENRMTPKQFPEWFFSQSLEDQEQVLLFLSEGIVVIEDGLISMKDVANGQDD